ncbi:MAG: hypothetical protein JW994_04100 [Candidatus Omnitrophica bacterium]|nr:hypothetical protein [Candidatus Omnitrophota bacterium]
MPNILFRADAHKEIGTGDLMSVIYLSREFQNNSWHCFFAVRDYEPALSIVRQFGLQNVEIIPHGILLKNEIELIKKLCADNEIDCLFMEVTKNNLREYGALGKPAPVKACANFDGIITEDFDIVVNWCVDASDTLYGGYECKNTKFVLGFENAILPESVLKLGHDKKSPNKKAQTILITMGGADEFNLTHKVLKSLASCASACEIKVIIGPGYEHSQDSLNSIGTNFHKFSLIKDAKSLDGYYRWADMAFSAGGLTSSELVAAKIPAVLIAAHEHQIKRCECYSRKNWAFYAGCRKNISEMQIEAAFYHVNNNIQAFNDSLGRCEFRGGNEKIYKDIDTCRQSKELVS